MDAKAALAFYRNALKPPTASGVAAAALGPDGWPGLCTCNHSAEQHDGSGLGCCTELDSYGQPCACPSFERATSDGE